MLKDGTVGDVYGGVKFDRIQPETTGKNTPYGKAKDGYGNVPYAREEFVGDIKAYFVLDLALLRGYGFSDSVFEFLTTLATLKVRRFLEYFLRLRTACDLELVDDVVVTRPKNSAWILPSVLECEEIMPPLISSLAAEFGPSPLQVKYNPKLAKAKEKKSEESDDSEVEG